MACPARSGIIPPIAGLTPAGTAAAMVLAIETMFQKTGRTMWPATARHHPVFVFIPHPGAPICAGVSTRVRGTTRSPSS